MVIVGVVQVNDVTVIAAVQLLVTVKGVQGSIKLAVG